jgi:RNA polymerase sigma-70 factor (ECF subfamily)
METHLWEARRTQALGDRPAASAIDDLEDAAAVYWRIRPSLLTVAYRILGNATEAEDVLQEVWLRLHRTDRHAVHSPAALLRTITVRVAINVLHSARRRREYCATPWLPELPDTDTTPETVAERQDAVEGAVGLLLETLTPRQRAAFVLREGFGYPYDRIAALLDISVVNARQQVARAQRHLLGHGRRRSVDAVTHRRLVQAFFTAAQAGDMARLEQVLLDDVGRPEGTPADRTADAWVTARE